MSYLFFLIIVGCNWDGGNMYENYFIFNIVHCQKIKNIYKDANNIAKKKTNEQKIITMKKREKGWGLKRKVREESNSKAHAMKSSELDRGRPQL